MNDLSGTQLGQYQLLSILGKGGMATVYRAHQPAMDRDVAIKIIAPDLASDPEFAARFEREAQIIAKLQHPHILPVYDFGRENDLTYLVMRLMEGGSLAQELRDGSVAIDRAIELVRQIASALDYAHRRGIVHRDLKPTNVLLDDLGNAYLTDFGIAKMIAGSATTGLTVPGSVMGTPTYMAPEQWRAEPVDGRTDVYALGVILYEMLLGKVPFAAETPHGLMYQHLDIEPPTLHTLKPDLPASIELVVRKALAKRKEDRYASASDLALDLEQVLHAPGRLPEQTLFDAPKFTTTISGSGKAEYDEMVEDELMALADESEDADLQPTVPPHVDRERTLPPAYVPPPPPADPTVPAPGGYVPPPAPIPGYQPPVYVPPHVPLAYDDQVPDSVALGNWLWITAAAIGAIVIVVAVVVISVTLLSGDSSASPTPPPAVTNTPLYRPSAFVIAPANNTPVNLGDTITIQFTATDNSGITRVDLRRFDQVLQTVVAGGQTTFQGVFEYEPDSTGVHLLEIVPWQNTVRGDPATLTLIVR